MNPIRSSQKRKVFQTFPDLRERISKSLEVAEKIHRSEEFAELRVFRTEELAHSLNGISKDRKKFGFLGEAPRPSFSMIMSLSEQAIQLIDAVISYWEFHIENSEQTLRLYAAYARTYWKALPDFSDVEDMSFVSDAF